MATLTIKIPEEALSALRENAGAVRGRNAVCRRRPVLSPRPDQRHKAAQIAGMTRLEFLDEMARRQLDVVKIDADQIGGELADG